MPVAFVGARVPLMLLPPVGAKVTFPGNGDGTNVTISPVVPLVLPIAEGANVVPFVVVNIDGVKVI